MPPCIFKDSYKVNFKVCTGMQNSSHPHTINLSLVQVHFEFKEQFIIDS